MTSEDSEGTGEGEDRGGATDGDRAAGGEPGGASGSGADTGSGSGTGSGGEAGSGDATGSGTAAQGGGQEFPDRVYRSAGGMAGGIVLLAIGLWLATDAVIGGEGRTPWLALAAMLCVVPLVVAFTLRPAVFAGERRMRVRNPFRTIEVPWGAVESLRAGYSSEVLAGGAKYQLWSIPVSLRARKKATRHNERISSGRAPAAGPGGLFGGRGVPNMGPDASELQEKRAASDQSVDELRELAETHGRKDTAQGEVAVRWSFEVIAPAVAGAVLLAILLATG
ncbi:PH domain-containing protein [Streptomyces qinglanensis]|uniref:PH domain-containing protein n=1 Tax=Streptomyces qinglanensis TaxID=943816 RepID=A0A1H9V8U3_9ACTN|nr:PH domain-containing protein [Streptomyces qinglanensis]